MEKEWFEQLTDAQKAKLKAMDGNVTVEQLTAFCKEEKLPLPDDALEEVAGGEGICIGYDESLTGQPIFFPKD